MKQLRRLRFLQEHWLVLACLACGAALFLWRLGSTGQVDETPPLFAASARGMAESGDWLTPRVNGLPRYDKPPLVYWLMALGYALPAQGMWNPLGTWASSWPSAAASIAVMLVLALTVARCWGSRLAGLTAALAFALSPLNLLWGRLAVSDALFSGLVSLSLLLFWQTQAQRQGSGAWTGWWHGWLLLGLAVLAKGPVAVVLVGLTLLVFALSCGELPLLLRGLGTGRGLALTVAVSLPWYVAELLVEGKPYWDSFFGYHNMQRFTSVVNDHLQPWWFFGGMLVIASLPASPLLLLELLQQLRRPLGTPADSLSRFAACWLLVVLGFFTLAATKLPSYWIPATPAAAILIAAATGPRAAAAPRWPQRLAWGATLALATLMAAVLGLAPLWFGQVQDPEMPSLAADVLASGLLSRAALCFALAAGLPLLWQGRKRLLALQLPVMAFAVMALQPLWALGDQLRGAPVRQMATAIQQQRQQGESVAMVGILKPSLHYYSRRVVLYEGIEPADLSNLADRLSREQRRGQAPSSSAQQPSVLVVIDARTAALPHWQGLQPQALAQAGLYRLWRLDRRRLEQRARALAARGIQPTWQRPRPERY